MSPLQCETNAHPPAHPPNHHPTLPAGEGVLALPKLNLQFLTFHDYLLRNFNLFRLEATCAGRRRGCSGLQQHWVGKVMRL